MTFGGKQFRQGFLSGLLLGVLIGGNFSLQSAVPFRDMNLGETSPSVRSKSTQQAPMLGPPTLEDKLCTPAQTKQQMNASCGFFAGRHNLPIIFPLLRYNLPEATVLVDVGANKGLVSARWLELWRPHLMVTPKSHANGHVGPSFDTLGIQQGRICGITDMCYDVNQTERDWLAKESPIPQHVLDADQFTVHSFEPSAVLFHINNGYANLTAPTKAERHDSIIHHWKWHNIAACDENTVANFPSLSNEGGSLNFRSKGQEDMIATRVATLDTLALEDHLFDADSKDLIVDVLKIDAESVDARVVVGARTLLQQQRIRVVMWETPNSFPLTFDDETVAKDFGGLVNIMDQYGLTCYYPGWKERSIRLTGCEPLQTSQHRCSAVPSCPRRECALEHSNVVCVHRKLAPKVYHALERQSLADMAG